MKFVLATLVALFTVSANAESLRSLKRQKFFGAMQGVKNPRIIEKCAIFTEFDACSKRKSPERLKFLQTLNQERERDGQDLIPLYNLGFNGTGMNDTTLLREGEAFDQSAAPASSDDFGFMSTPCHMNTDGQCTGLPCNWLNNGQCTPEYTNGMCVWRNDAVDELGNFGCYKNPCFDAGHPYNTNGGKDACLANDMCKWEPKAKTPKKCHLKNPHQWDRKADIGRYFPVNLDMIHRSQIMENEIVFARSNPACMCAETSFGCVGEGGTFAGNGGSDHIRFDPTIYQSSTMRTA